MKVHIILPDKSEIDREMTQKELDNFLYVTSFFTGRPHVTVRGKS